MSSATKKRELNEYLFLEFGLGDEVDDAPIGEDWPFALVPEGDLALPEGPISVFSFADERGERFYAISGPHLDYWPSAGMSVADLEIQERGRSWIGQRDPVDLDTSRIGYADIPPVPARRAAIERMVGEAGLTLGSASVREGLYLASEGRYLAFVEPTDGPPLLLLNGLVVRVEPDFPAASTWRRLSHAVGRLVSAGELS